MEETNRKKSLFLSFLMLTSVMVGLVGIMPTATAATNETSSGAIVGNAQGIEVWSGSHTVTGDVIIPTGKKLIIQPGTTVTMANGTLIDVRGGFCAGDASCGASGTASNSSRITFNWQNPANESAIGSCIGLFSNNVNNPDASCNEGILLRSTVDIAATILNHVSINGAYGMPRWVSEISEVRYGALVAQGASPTMSALKFTNINTTSLLILDLARPDIVGGEFTVGSEARDPGLIGSAIQAFGAGSSLQPLMINSAVFSGTANGCGQNENGRHVIWVEESFVDIQYSVIPDGDYGIRLDSSAGHVSSSTIETTCNGIDVNSKKTVGNNVAYKMIVENNKITTEERSPLTAFNFAWVDFNNNIIDGASGGSGVQVQQSQVNVSGGTIGPIGGWNGIWSTLESDVRVENVTIQDTAQEPIVAGQYPWASEGWKTVTENRMYVANSVITGSPSGCQSEKLWGGEFACPAVHSYGASVSLIGNQFDIGGGGDAIRAAGSILDVRNNEFNVSGTGAMIKNIDTNYANDPEYGSLGFFSMNSWIGVGQTYNVTKSSITVQSENIPIPNPASNQFDPATLSWPDAQASPGNNWQGQILLSASSAWPPQNFPLAMELTNNSTVFTYSNLTGLDTSNIYIDTSPIKWAVQIRKAEIVKFRTLVEGVRVGDATILIEDSRGDDLYTLTTDSLGWTPEISLASDFHLDMTGGGPGGINPDRYADDASENSCSDGIDNDGDFIFDANDPDCQNGENSRELSLYYVSAYKFGKGYKKYSITMTSQVGVLSEIISLENKDPTVTVDQSDGYSFKRSVNFTGTAHDGTWAGIYASDELAQWDQQGVVEEVQVKDPFTSNWIDMKYAVDDSNADGQVTYNNHPFSHWYYEYDMSDQPEGDYTFEFRAFDGVTESLISTRTIRLNTEPPSIWVDGPADGTQINNGIIQFEGRASDAYSGIYGSDIQRIWFEVEGPDNYYNLFDKPGSATWSTDWTVGHLPSGTYSVKVWASDSAFCISSAEECTPVEMTLEIDNDNAIPLVQLLQPYDLTTITASEETLLSGVARDTDGTVTKVEIVIKDPQAGFLEMPEGPHSLVTSISPAGEWETKWDTTNLVHNYHYIIEVRSFDGFQYSEVSSIEVIIDNPPNQDNNRPVFNSTAWPDSVTIFCEETGASQNRCGSGHDIDLTQFFSDPDGDDLTYYVLDQDDKLEDDYHYDVISINTDGVANYNPLSMSFYLPNMEDWSLGSVIFEVRDPAGSIVASDPLNFDVVGVSFSSKCAGLMIDGGFVAGCPVEVSQADTLVYTGSGRPTVNVVGETSGGIRLGNTEVSDDGTWTLEIPVNRLDKGDNTIVFEYGNVEQPTNADSEIIVEGGADEGSSLFMWIGLGLVAMIVLAALGAVFVFFFVEFEEEDLEDEMMTPAEEVDPYAWAKAKQQEQAPAIQSQQQVIQQPASQSVAAAPAVAGYPGWKWDAAQNKWVPDQE